jgi:hypothetical protein
MSSVTWKDVEEVAQKLKKLLVGQSQVPSTLLIGFDN